MKEKIIRLFCVLPLLLLLPYLMVIVFQNTETALLIRKYDQEELLPMIVNKQITGQYNIETIKCQAIIARSNLYRHVEVIGDMESYLSEILLKNSDNKSCLNKIWELFQMFVNGKEEKAVLETAGVVLREKGEWRLIPFHEISNGKTRSGMEVFHDAKYKYLQSVSSQMDCKADGFISKLLISKSKIQKQLKITSRDSSGYVLTLAIDGRPIEGEAFREGFHLESSDFTIQDLDSHYEIICRGKGHGIGFSQYGGEILANKGAGYKEILAVYFPVLNIETVF